MIYSLEYWPVVHDVAGSIPGITSSIVSEKRCLPKVAG